MGLLSEPVEVVKGVDGLPLAVKWDGQWHCLAGDPWHGVERRRWWEDTVVVDHEMWRLPVQRASGGPVMVFDVSHRLDTGEWWMVCLHAEVVLPS